jgi:predicted AAA+ superfamily ATPase
MPQSRGLLARACAAASRLVRGFRPAAGTTDAAAYRWRAVDGRWTLEPVHDVSRVLLDDLKCIDRQKSEVVRNTRQFLAGLPANNVLLWGPRGTGKSSLVRAVFNAYRDEGLGLVEVPRDRLQDLPDICRQLEGSPRRYIVYCDDLSFEADDIGFKALKSILDGSVSAAPENVLVYATSNRRHLMPEYMSENLASRVVDGELHLSDTAEEKLSLSERFGLRLAFHPFTQDQFLEIVDHWLARLGAPVPDREAAHRAALQWALDQGSRSGRVAWQFARDWAGRQALEAR